MLWLFGQTWIWILIAFILGLIIGYLISRFLGKQKQAEVTEERVAAPAGTPARERSLDDDFSGRATVGADAPSLDATEPTQILSPPSADADAPSVDADAEKPAMSMIDDKDTGVDAGGAAAGAGALGLAGAGAATLGSRDDTTSADVDAPSVDAEAPSVDGAVDVGLQEAAYGPASALPIAGGAAPSAEFTVKGNEDSMLYHTTDSPYYSRTKAEVWFKTPADAEAAGFTPWNELRRTDAPAASAPAAPAAQTTQAAAASGAVGGGTVMGAGAVDTEPDTGRIPVQSAETATAPLSTDGQTPSTDGQAASPYGPGSALPLAGGAAPSAEYTVKGNADSMLYHTTESPYYPRTRAEVWFTTPAEAEAAGFTAWNRRR